ncbi:MAG: hypothetical protein QM523_02785 [Candidatus Pacebacteria bacterium]|nr:hypothetical protein [Candidatus Paceibacterota bacterium]
MIEFFDKPVAWVALGFVLFVILLWKPGKKAILGGVDDHIAKIKNQLDEARRLHEEAKIALEQAHERQAKMFQLTEDLQAEARRDIEEMTAKAMAEVTQIIANRRAEAEGRIIRAEATAEAEIHLLATAVVMEALRNVMTKQGQGAVATRLNDEAISQLPL